MANTRLTRTFGSGNQQIWTLSFWIKRAELSSAQFLFNTDGGNEEDRLQLNSANALQWFEQNSSAGTDAELTTNQVFRDTSAWYHIVLSRDSTQGTASNRIKIYVNGSQVTSFATATYPSLNDNSRWNSAVLHEIGARNSTGYFNGSMSHIHFIDGTAYDATAFGEYDANGVWKINTSPSVTYGTNGFFILKNGNSVTDQSGNSNNFTVGGGTLTNTEDSPSNVFCTMNPLDTFNSPTITNGNTVCNAGSSDKSMRSTIGISSGKWYWEVNTTANNSANMGIINGEAVLTDGNSLQSVSTNSVIWEGNGGLLFKNGSSVTTEYSGGTATYGFAFDLDNGTLKLSQNGTFYNSGNAVVTGITADTYLPFFAPNGGGSPTEFQVNFGNGYFGTTAVSSAGTNASGNGIFEYDVPTGYTALSTKGLNL